MKFIFPILKQKHELLNCLFSMYIIFIDTIYYFKGCLKFLSKFYQHFSCVEFFLFLVIIIIYINT